MEKPIVKDDDTVISPDLSSTIDDELLRSRIRTLIDEKPADSFFQRISTNPLTAILIGFLLTGVIGGFLTNYYSVKQKELELQRTEQQRESDRLKDEQQRELDRKREDDKRQSDVIREDQQRESDRLYQTRQKDNESQRSLQQRESERLKDIRQKAIESQRALQQRESERLRDVRQKGLEEQIRKQELVERLDLEIGYRFSQVQIRLSSFVDTSVDTSDKNYPLLPGKGEKDVRRILDSLLIPPKDDISPLYQDFSNFSTIALIAELRRYVSKKEKKEIDDVLADLSGIYIHLDVEKVKLSNPHKVAELVFEDLMLQRWKESEFYYTDCVFC